MQPVRNAVHQQWQRIAYEKIMETQLSRKFTINKAYTFKVEEEQIKNLQATLLII